MKSNDFNRDLKYSLDERENEMFDSFYYRAFPGLKVIEFAKDLPTQRKGIDKILHFKSGKTITIDEKKRRKDYGDILLELISVVEKSKPGWLLTCQCDYIVYAVMPTKKVYLLPTLLLKKAWVTHREAWKQKYKKPIMAKNDGYWTASIGIPADELLNAITAEMTQQLAETAPP